MRPVAELPEGLGARLRAVLADIDDTLTSNGRLTAGAYAALERLSDSGLLVIPVTGRPAGWCDHIARMWPVDAVVGENGAFWFRYDRDGRRLVRSFQQDCATRRSNRRRLERLREEILATVEGAGIASDQSYRENDLAIDYCEDVAPLSEEAVARIVEIGQRAGARVKVSSIHVNMWFGDYDKLTTARSLLAGEFGVDLDSDPDAALFVGDSPNDAPMFRAFANAVGVANVRDFLGALEHEPAYVTERRAGAGFAELAEILIAARTD